MHNEQKNAIELAGVAKRFGKEVVFEAITLSLPADRYLLVGANGVGKSTLLEMLVGIQAPTKGTINVSGDADLVADSIQFPADLTVNTIFSLYQRYQRLDISRKEALIEQFMLTDYLTSSVSALSQGTVQKLRLILALAGNRQWLLLDEPYNGLDKQSQQILNQLLEASPRPMILIDHSGVASVNGLKTLSLKKQTLCID